MIFINRNEAYEVLGLKQGANKDEIKSAYRELVKKFHADKVLHIEDENVRKSAKELFEEKMRKMNEAYEILTSPSGSHSNASRPSSSQSAGDSSSRPFTSEDEELERIHTMYFKQKESELFQQSFEKFRKDTGYKVYDEQKKSEKGPLGQIIDIVDEETPATPFDTYYEEKKPEKKEKKEKKPAPEVRNPWKIPAVFLLIVYTLGWILAGSIYLFGAGEDPDIYITLRIILTFSPFIAFMSITYIFPGKIKYPPLSAGKPINYVFSWFLISFFIILSFISTVLFSQGKFDRTMKVLVPEFVITDKAIENLEFELPDEKIEIIKLIKDKSFSREQLNESLINFSPMETGIVLSCSIKGNLNKDFATPQRQFIAYFFLANSFCLILSSLLALGSEYAWRGFLFEELSCLGRKKAAILTGLLWGVSYVPLVLTGDFTGGKSFFWVPWTGENPWYSVADEYFKAAPFTGIFVKIFFSLFFGFILAWLYFISRNIFLPCFAYAVFEQMTPLGYIFIRDANPLTGGPEGLCGIGILIIIFFIFLFLPWKEKC